MAYNFIMETAVELAKKRYSGGIAPQMGDTVCVIFAGNGSVYTGINTVRNNGSFSENIHAEIDAVSRMRAEGETVVKAITVFDSCNISPILPCNGCINLIMSLNSENVNAEVVTPRGSIPLAGIGNMNSQKSYAGPGTVQGGSAYMSSGYMNPAAGQGMAPSYMSQGAVQGGSVYMNPSGQVMNSMYMNPSSQPGSVFFSAAASVYAGQNGGNQGPVRKSYAAGGAQNNNLMKNKISNLFDDDDE